MIGSYIAAALRNLVRNRAYTGVSILGLAIGFSAVILIALYVRDEYSYDRFFPNHDRIFKVGEIVNVPGQAPQVWSSTFADIPSTLKLEFPQVDMVARLEFADVTLRRGNIETTVSPAYWADPEFFRMFPLKTIAGSLPHALDQPDGIVLTRKIAQRFFGRDDVVGQTIELNREHLMRVAAVIEDLPSNTHLAGEAFLPGVAQFSEISRKDAEQWGSNNDKSDGTQAYVRLRPGANIDEISAAIPVFVHRHLPRQRFNLPFADDYMVTFTPVAQVHLTVDNMMKPKGDLRTLHAMIGVALLILFVAGSNFVNMMTARAARRAVEVGVRKAVGATRRQIISQFMGECLFYVGLAVVVAIVAVTLLLPGFNGFLGRTIRFDYLQDPLLAFGIIFVTLLTGVAAGVYPSVVVSRFRPSIVLKGTTLLLGHSGRLRQALVIFQFSTLVVLIVATMTIHRQVQFALDERLHVAGDQMYMSGIPGTQCSDAFVDAIAQVRGVRGVSCPSGGALEWGVGGLAFSTPSRAGVLLRESPVDYHFFDLFGIKPLAGRLFSQEHGEDDALHANSDISASPTVILNESAMRALGFGSPEAAVDHTVRWTRLIRKGNGFKVADNMESQIIGVVPDLPFGSIRHPIQPMAYFIDPGWSSVLLLKLSGGAIPETMRALKEIWTQQKGAQAFEGQFFDQIINETYTDIIQESTLFSVFAAVVLVIATLGLLGLAVYTAERRTKEIGLRKVMGASRLDILGFLTWEFARPVLWANLLAWPCAYLLLQRWLEGFAYHISQHFMYFIIAGALALIVALITVCGHAMTVARAKPVEALRYE
jgi:putative ABC transport system permease protein